MRAGKKPKRYWVKSEIDFLIENRGKYDYNERGRLGGIRGRRLFNKIILILPTNNFERN